MVVAGILPPALPFQRRALGRLDEIALLSQFEHRDLRSEGAWGVPCLSPHPCHSAPLARAGLFMPSFS